MGLGFFRLTMHFQPSPFEVDYGVHKRITRGAVDLNESVLEPVIKHLGSRVGVDTLQFHVEALYHIMELPCPSI